MKTRPIYLAILVAASAAYAIATPITLTISATGSGMIGSTPFTNELITFTQVTDTSDISPSICGGAFPCALETKTNTVSIAGVGTATLTDNTFFFNNSGVLGMDDNSSFDLLDESSASFTGYSMTTSLGPVSGSIVHPTSTLSGIDTSNGSLSYTFSGNATFQATLGSSGAPEPGSLGLMLAGAISLAAGLSRKRTGRG